MPILSLLFGRSRPSTPTKETPKGGLFHRKRRIGKTRACNEPWRVENILKSPPTEESWWEGAEDCCSDEEAFADTIEDNTAALDTQSSTGSSSSETNTAATRKFHNQGYDAWEKARAAWRTPSTSKRAVHRPLPPYVRERVARGVTLSTRCYELPHRMALKDMVDIYTDIWDGEL